MNMPVELQGVPETLLWTLYHRASEARRSDAVLHDPKAVELLDAMAFPFEQRFGAAGAGLSQWQALRALRQRPGELAVGGSAGGDRGA